MVSKATEPSSLTGRKNSALKLNGHAKSMPRDFGPDQSLEDYRKYTEVL
jgi:hypothetical protein